MAGLQRDIHVCLVYLDDTIILGKTFDEIMVNLGRVYDRISVWWIATKGQKCHLFQRSVEFLGHIILEEGMTTDPEKIHSVGNWSVLFNASEIRSFLGDCVYYRKRFLRDCIHKLTEKKAFILNKDCHVFFDKQNLALSPVIGNTDFT